MNMNFVKVTEKIRCHCHNSPECQHAFIESLFVQSFWHGKAPFLAVSLFHPIRLVDSVLGVSLGQRLGTESYESVQPFTPTTSKRCLDFWGTRRRTTFSCLVWKKHNRRSAILVYFPKVFAALLRVSLILNRFLVLWQHECYYFNANALAHRVHSVFNCPKATKYAIKFYRTSIHKWWIHL